MLRPAQRLTRILACAAAVPVILVSSGCSSNSGSSSDGAGQKTDPGATASASTSGGGDAGSKVKQAAYSRLPEPCAVVSKKTLGELVPKAGSGSAGKSEDTSSRGTCSWSSLDNNGVKGSQFRWLNVSLLRFASDAARGSGDELASQYVAKQVRDAQATDGAANVKTAAVSGTGDEAQAVRYDLKKKEGVFKQQTVVTRVENVVVTIDYNGAGLAGDKSPSADDLMKAAQKAAKEAVNAVVTANGTSSSTPSSKPSDKNTTKPKSGNGP